jgi:hypothetical protein
MHDVVLVFIEEYSDTVAVDRVIEQEPRPMVPVEKFSSIEVIISAGPEPSRSFVIYHEIASNRRGDFILEYYIDGFIQHDLTRQQNIELNREIRWEVEGTDVQNYAIYITSVETGRRLRFVVYEVDFSGDAPAHRIIEFNDRIFAELSESSGSEPTITLPNDNPPPVTTDFCFTCINFIEYCTCATSIINSFGF